MSASHPTLLFKWVNYSVGAAVVQNACLLLASHKVLLSFIRNNQEVLDALKAQAGAHSSAVLHYLLRFSMFFQRHPFESSIRWSGPLSTHGSWERSDCR